MLNILNVREKIKQFYIDDNHYCDISTQVFDEDLKGRAIIKAKESGYFSGGLIIEEGFKLIDPDIKMELLIKDGDEVEAGDIIADMTGNIRAILTMERTVLNLVQRMSGITTKTREYVRKTTGTNTKIIDTRKTTPGLGMFEKYAVIAGGGRNHRRTLNDGVMLKDNHIDFMGSMTNAIERAKSFIGPMDKIEVEIEDLEMLKEAIANNVDIIMFDNCGSDWIEAHIHLVPEHIQTEASGGINMDTVAAYAGSGVDFISVGALFHNPEALDISLKVVK